MLTVVCASRDGDGSAAPAGAPGLIDEIVREGARRMLAEALQAQVDAYIAHFADERDEAGRRLVAIAKISDDVEQLLSFYDYPAQHWVHLRTTNRIESTFATVRNRSNITKALARGPRESPWPTS